MKMLTTTITLAALALPLAACGGDDDSGGGGASAEEIAQAFVDQGAPEDEAACVADKVAGSISLSDVEDFANAVDPDDVDADVLETIGEALNGCIG
ncbi:MAG: hypothetical protein RIB65_17025 [Ilumatobacter fluminis]|jgi:hypothetical protein|uniref:hypothetical protein n=1 Tax=Ilumatobacter fluminis TaxID=467091 RepID=UPI0032ED48F8